MKRLLIAALFCLGAGLSYASSIDKALVDKSVAPIDFQTQQSLSGIDRLSAQAIYSDGTPASVAFDHGTISTATLTVVNYDILTNKSATVNVTISSYTALDDEVLTMNGIRFKEGAGGNWTEQTTATATAISLASAINANASFNAEAVAAVVYATSTASGTFGNGWSVVSSTPAALTPSAATFTGGQNVAKINVYTQTLIQGTDWTAATSSAATANSILAAINANATLTAIVTASTSTDGIVDLVSDDIGSTRNYTLYTTTPAALSWNGDVTNNTQAMIGGSDSDLDFTSDTITVANHGLETGLAVLYSTSASTITGLTDQTTYYAIKSTKNIFQLATTTGNAIAGTDIDISAATNGGAYTAAPLALSGTPSFKWQASNDGSSWSDLSISSVTYSAAGNTIWDLGELAYKYIRVNYLHPNQGQGGLDLLIQIYGKLD